MSGATGIPLAQLLAGLVRALKPAAILCVDSLCTSDPARLGRTIQISDTGLSPARPDSGRCITRAMLGVPVLAVGVPTLMEADGCMEKGKGLKLALSDCYIHITKVLPPMRKEMDAASFFNGSRGIIGSILN